MEEEKKFELPKGPTIAGTAVIAFLIGAIIFGYLGYYLTKKSSPPCPTCISKECEECEVCEYSKQQEKENEPTQPIQNEVQKKETSTENYKYIYTVKVVSYEPNPNNYLGFMYCDNAISSCIIHGVEIDKIAKATLGEEFIIKYNDNNIAKDGVATGTRYIDLIGDFYLMPV